MNNNRSDALPQNWVYIDIGTCYKVVGGGTPSTSVKEYWGGETPWITSADIGGVRDIHLTRHVTQKGIRESATNMVPERSLLVATRVGLGKIAITDKPICFSQDLQGLVQRPDIILPEYGLFYLSFQLQRLKFEGHGTTISGITKKQLKDTELPLPPYQEQRRIVAKIEELFSELDKGIESLKTARAKLKVYRQSVLKHAFEGKLTAQWREENKDKLESPEQMLARIKQEREARYEQQLQKWKATVKEWELGGKFGRKPTKPKMLRSFSDFADNQPLNDMWPIFELGDLISVSSGQSLTSKAMKGGRYPVYGGNGITGYHDEYLVSEPTLIIGRVGAKCGVTHITSENSWITDNALIASPLIRSFDKCYFKFLLEQKNLNILGSSTGQPVISGAKIYPVHIPLPTLAEQMQIGDAIEKANSLIDDQSVAIDNQLQKAEALRQSILKKAFSGQLVAQDPNDEPASILLERIRAENTAQSQKNARAKRRRTAATT